MVQHANPVAHAAMTTDDADATPLSVSTAVYRRAGWLLIAFVGQRRHRSAESIRRRLARSTSATDTDRPSNYRVLVANIN